MTDTIILAAGNSTRIKSKKSKVLHEILGKKVLDYVVDLSAKFSDNIIMVLSPNAKEIEENYKKNSIKFAIQKEAIGTQNALKSGLHLVKGQNVLVMCGDTPCVKDDTIDKLFQEHKNNNNKLTMLSVLMDDPSSYGRVKRENGNVIKIVELKDATEEEKKIKEINSGIYLFDSSELIRLIDEVKNDNAQKEYYLTDLIEIFTRENLKIGALTIDDADEIIGVNNRVDLNKATKVLQDRINNYWMNMGVTMLDPSSIFIDYDVELSRDVLIKYSCEIKGATKISEDVLIGANTYIENSIIGTGTSIVNSTILNSTIGANNKIGPYSYIRPGTEIGNDCKIGDFVEVKNSKVGNNTKASHLSYIGDSDLGSNINIGCGAIFVNYDGKNKYRSTVEDNAFIGCNTNIVSPVRIKEGAFIAAGTTVTEDVDSNNLCIGRVRQTQKKGWNKEK